jgi:mycothiol synthase
MRGLGLVWHTNQNSEFSRKVLSPMPSDQTITLTPFDLRGADDEAYRPLWELSEQLRIERRPDDPSRSLALYASQNRSIPDFVHAELALARRSDDVAVGFAEIGFDTGEQNRHAMQLDLKVLAAERRQGIGRRLLAWGVAEARKHNRSLLVLGTSDRVPAGAIFAERIGATRGLENRISQLNLAELDRHLLRTWQERAVERAADFELLAWDDIVPESDIDAFADLCEVMNSAPRGQLELEDEKITPEKIRAWMQSMSAGGYHVWTLVARERTSGALVGVTELFYMPAHPTILDQGATAVRPEYRNRGLGRWLKAAMLDRALRELPAARFVRTGNAESNAPMLAINVALGFKPYEATTIWQVETECAAAYINTRPGSYVETEVHP